MEFDVVVLGTGAAGLVAALAAHEGGASVGLFEKAHVVGGTSAISGGTCWVPNNPHMAAAGAPDSREDALAYLASLSHGLIDPAMAETLVDTGPQVVTWLEAHTPVRFQVVQGFPDYHPEHPGGKPRGGRSLDPSLFSFRELGEWADRVAVPARSPYLSLVETPLGGGDGTIDRAELARRREADIRGCGQALVGGLLKACLDRGIVPVTGATADRLQVVDGAVTGVRFATDAGPLEVAAHRGVVIATGGFEWDDALVRDFLLGPMTSPATVPTNTGDGLRLAMAAGAQLGNMREAWWVPTIEIPGDELFGRQRAHLILRERTLPRSIMVNRTGRRFTNEAANYNAMGGAFHQFDAGRFEYANLPCWLVVDQEYLDRYGFAGVPAGAEAPAWLTRSDTVDGLAREIGVAPEGLVATVERWNAQVAAGRDPDFGRGDSAYDGWSGDQARYPSRESTLGPLDRGPFYAVEVRSGALGTKGGPRTTTDAQVLHVSGDPVPGLYAVGNAMAGATGMVYGGAGGTLGPGLSFGWRAGRHAAAAAARTTT
jgi:3-oxosteroid 1-dehydrogenase